jgi:hypothetical protein
MPDSATWTCDPTSILEYTDRITTVAPDGLTYHRHKYLAAVIATLLKCDIAHDAKRRLITRTLIHLKHNKSVTKDAFLKQFDIERRKWFAVAKQPYHFVTCLSVSNSRFKRAQSANIDECKIRIAPKLPVAFLSAHYSLYDSQRKTFPEYATTTTLDLAGMAKVLVKVMAHSEIDAAEKALEALDVYRGYANLLVNGHTMPIIWMSGRPHPPNSIRFGPIHTLHNADGTLASKLLWYEQEYQKPRLLNYSDSLKCASLQGCAKLYGNHPYKDIIQEALVKYVRALDSANFDYAFVSLHGVIERLAGEGKDEIKGKRVAALDEDQTRQETMFRCLNDHRNRIVHHGIRSAEVEELLYLIKSFAELLLDYHVFNVAKHTSFSEAIAFLDVLYNVKNYDATGLLKRSLRFRKYLAKDRSD